MTALSFFKPVARWGTLGIGLGEPMPMTDVIPSLAIASKVWSDRKRASSEGLQRV